MVQVRARSFCPLPFLRPVTVGSGRVALTCESSVQLFMKTEIRWSTGRFYPLCPAQARRAVGTAMGEMEHADGTPNHEGWSQIRSVLQLAKHTIVHGILQSYQMPVVMNMMGAICTIEISMSFLRFPMMVKRNGQQHRYINQ